MTKTKTVNFDHIDDEIKKIGAFISSVIKERKIAKADIAKAIDMSSNTVSNCCKGNNPNIKTLFAIGRAVGITSVEMITQTEGIEIEAEDEDDLAEEPMAAVPEETEVPVTKEPKAQEHPFESPYEEAEPEQAEISNLIPKL